MEIRLPLILDAATGTQLQKAGFKSGSAEKWVIEHPQILQDIQRSYIDEGSNVVYASTFGASRPKLESEGIYGKVSEYNHRLVEISRKVADGRAYVAGDLSPTGKMAKPYGDTPFEELVEIYREQAQALEDAGVDLFVIETMISLSEMRAALLAVKSVSDKPVFTTFTCDDNGKTLTGTDVTAALIVMQGMGADAFGLNCSFGPAEMVPLFERLGKLNRIPLIAKPNAGKPDTMEDGTVRYNLGPAEFASYIKDFADNGVEIFGACCGSTKEYIRAIRETLDHTPVHSPSPEHTDLLPAATEKKTFLLSPGAAHGYVLKCDDYLEESLEEDAESSAEMTAISITSEEQVDILCENQVLIQKPLCIVCDDAELLDKALMIYNGRALYEGNLTDEELAPLVKKYGLLI